jgi:hypothetical protein
MDLLSLLIGVIVGLVVGVAVATTFRVVFVRRERPSPHKKQRE